MQVADSVAAVVVVASSLSPSAVEASSSLETSVAAADLEVVAFLLLPLPMCDLTVPLNLLAVDSSVAAFAAEAAAAAVVAAAVAAVGSCVADSFDHASALCSLLPRLLLAELLLITVPATVAVAADLDLLLQVAVDLAVLVPASYVEVVAAWAYLASFDEAEVAFLDDGDGVDVLVVVAWAYLLLLLVVVVLAS